MAIKTTALVCPDLAIGWGTAFELNCTVSPISESSAPRRSWNGTLHESAPDVMRQYRVVLSASGDLLPPALSAMWSGHRFTAAIPLPFGGGETGGRAVHRDFRVDDDGVHGTTGDRLYQIFELELQVVEPWTATLVDNRAEVSWQVVAEEWKVPTGGTP